MLGHCLMTEQKKLVTVQPSISWFNNKQTPADDHFTAVRSLRTGLLFLAVFDLKLSLEPLECLSALRHLMPGACLLASIVVAEVLVCLVEESSSSWSRLCQVGDSCCSCRDFPHATSPL